MEPKRTVDSETLKNISKTKKKAKTKLILNSLKPSTFTVPESSIFDRVQNFIPRMEASEKEIKESKANMDFEVLPCYERSSDSDDSDSDSSEDEDTGMTTSDTGKKFVQLDLNLFKSDENVAIDEYNEAQIVNELPTAFKESEENIKPESEETPKIKKNLIEVIEP